MKLKILHLNIEKNKHLDSVRNLVQEQNPDVVCFAEAMQQEVEKMAIDLGYQFVFAPMVSLKDGVSVEPEGSIIFSRFPIVSTKNYRYDGNTSDEVPTLEDVKISHAPDDRRPLDRFLMHNALLTVGIQCGDNVVTIATTHFPVVDHNYTGLDDHELSNIEAIDEIELVEAYLDRLIPIIRSLSAPIIFTADLNNPRGENIYDTIAHELIDSVPKNISSTIDPILHRRKGLELVVDTIMTSPNIQVVDFKVIEGVSDHKALLAIIEA